VRAKGFRDGVLGALDAIQQVRQCEGLVCLLLELEMQQGAQGIGKPGIVAASVFIPAGNRLDGPIMYVKAIERVVANGETAGALFAAGGCRPADLLVPVGVSGHRKCLSERDCAALDSRAQ
jgi:hypothetical protein